MDKHGLIVMLLGAVWAKGKIVLVSHHCKLDWVRLIVGTHLWLCEGGYFQEGLTKKGKSCLNVGGTIPWTGVPD